MPHAETIRPDGRPANDVPVELLVTNLAWPRFHVVAATVGQLQRDAEALQTAAPELFGERPLVVTPNRVVALSLRPESLPAVAIHQPWAPTVTRAIHQGRLPADKPAADKARGILFEAGIALTNPSAERSLPLVAHLCRYLGDTPAVVFGGEPLRPNSGSLPRYDRYGILQPQVQVTPELVSAHGGYGQLARRLAGQGVVGVVADNHHLVRLPKFGGGIPQLDGLATLQEIAAGPLPICRLHVAAGRLDAGPKADRQRSMTELDVWLNRPERLHRTLLGQLTLRAYTYWLEKRQATGRTDRLPVTLEIPFTGLQAAVGGDLRPSKMYETYKRLGYALLTYLTDNTPAAA